jgi:glycosyltransferase involved in cell wall biosynthesis
LAKDSGPLLATGIKTNLVNTVRSNQNAVALFTLKAYLGVSTPILNLAMFLADHGYVVDLYAPPQMAKFRMPDLSAWGVNLHELENRLAQCFFLRDVEHLLTHLGPKRRYRFVIGDEPDGLLRASVFAWVWRVPYVYLSLDIAECHPAGGWRERLKKRVESFFSRRAIITVAMDDVRAQIIAEKNGIPRERICTVFNAGRGAPLPEKSEWLRSKFGIANDAFVVLAIGSLIPDTSIDRIVASVSSWSQRFVLVIHGWFVEPAFEARVRALGAQCPSRVFFSTDLFPAETKYKVFQSADVGLVFFEPTTTNLRFVGGAAGKLFDFMRTGVPVVAADLPGMRELVEVNGCGIVVRDPSGIGDALIKIVERYVDFSSRGLAAFPRYEFDASFTPVFQRILSLCPVLG